MELSDYFKLQPTGDQQQALTDLEAFLHGDSQVFLLKGYAGTGKTTLVESICNYLADQKIERKLMAPTGRAAMILSQKTNQSASTIHRNIYNLEDLKEKKEGTSFKMYYGLLAQEDSSRCVYLVDEASMISDVFNDDEFFMFGSGCLLSDLMRYASLQHSSRKIIFIGDQAQLPPVNMSYSPALAGSYFQRYFSSTPSEFTLSDVVRQSAGSSILKSATKIRNDIAADRYNSFGVHFDNQQTHCIAPPDFIDHYMQKAKANGVENCIVITHSNKQATSYNEQIRNLRYGERSNALQKKDRLLITKNNYNGPIELFNGMFADVLEVGDIVYRANPRFIIEKGKTEERKLDFREVMVEVKDIDGNKHPLRTTLIDKFLWSEEGRLHPYDQRGLYIDFKERMRKEGVKEKSKEFKERLRTDLYFNALQVKFGYAVTCHKSQGGEWKNVFVDFKVFIGRMSKAFFRWAYTGITRANQNLLCVDAPSFNAFNQFVVRPIEQLAGGINGAYYVPQSDGDPYHFIAHRKEQIEQLCAKQEIEPTVKEHNNQLDVTFRQEAKMARFQLWFKKGGFSKTTHHSSNDNSFRDLCEDILLESILPDELPFEPRFDFQNGLHNYILEIAHQQGIRLTNILQYDWHDRYFFYTGADCAMIDFYFNKQNIYTNATPKSTFGNDDKHLQALIEKLSGQVA